MGEFPLALSESKRQRSLVNIFGANQAQTSPILCLWLKIQPMANILLYGGKPSGQGLTMLGSRFDFLALEDGHPDKNN